jgi:hypothetical protein
MEKALRHRPTVAEDMEKWRGKLEAREFRYGLATMKVPQGSRLVLPRMKGLSVLVDGGRIDPSRTIDTAKLVAGGHTVDLSLERDGIIIDLQFALDIVPRLAFLDAEPSRQKHHASVRVRNQSPGPSLVRLEVVASPAGWNGFVAGDSVKFIAPGKTAAFQVGAFATDSPQDGKAAVALDLRATALGGKSPPRFQTVTVAP